MTRNKRERFRASKELEEMDLEKEIERTRNGKNKMEGKREGTM